jgi:hypothetical protein
MKGLYLASLLAFTMSGVTFFTSISSPKRPKKSNFSMENYHDRMACCVYAQDSIMVEILANVNAAHGKAIAFAEAAKKEKKVGDKRRKRTTKKRDSNDWPIRFTNAKFE